MVNCVILSTLYMRANGDIPCHDDSGQDIILGRVQTLEKNWSIGKVVNGPLFNSIRHALQNGRAPWPDTCPNCAWFRPNEPYADKLADRSINVFQVEPSLACNLRCPCCSQPKQLLERPKPYRMTLEDFEAALRSLRQEGFAIRELEYCGQGEAMTHPNFGEFVNVTRDLFPTTKQRLITNGNFDWKRAGLTQAIDEIMVSCDGLHQSSYSQYRQGGSVEKVFRFMSEAPKDVGGVRQRVVWKYILFEFNDSDEEITAAQVKARDLGVDNIFFVFTHSLYKSQRYTADRVAGFPVIWDGTIIGATPVHFQNVRNILPVSEEGWPASADGGSTVVMLDQLAATAPGEMHLRGWILSEHPVGAIHVSHNGRIVGETRRTLHRADVKSI